VPRFEPFIGIRYNTDSLDPRDVTAPPYDVISASDRVELVRRAPTNVVRVDLPVEGDDPYGDAARAFAQWRAEGVLVDDPEPSFTVYRMDAPDENGVVRHTTGSNLSAVWGLSPATGLTELLQCEDEPLTVFEADGVVHTVWRVTDPARLSAIRTAVGSAPIVIADGHHRYETSLAYRDERRADEGSGGAADSVMTFVVELVEDELTVGPIHRLIDGLPEGFDLREALAPFFTIEPFAFDDTSTVARMAQLGAMVLVLPDSTWSMIPSASTIAATRDLDSSRLDLALAALPDHSLTYQHGVTHSRDAVASGRAQASVLLRPVTIDQIVAIAEGGEKMPPKSTFFAPKPRTGIVFRSLD